MPKTTIRIRNLKHFRRTLTQDLHELFKPECTAAHNAQWAQTKQDIKITTTQTNMERHRSLKHTLLQVEIQKTSQKQLFTHCRSKKNSKGIPKARRSANMRRRISNIHESTRRFNAASRKNTKEHFKESLITRLNRQNTRPTARTRFKVLHILLWDDTAASACASDYDIYTHGFAPLKNHHHDTCTRTAT
jgi:hypothetical protein